MTSSKLWDEVEIRSTFTKRADRFDRELPPLCAKAKADSNYVIYAAQHGAQEAIYRQLSTFDCLASPNSLKLKLKEMATPGDVWSSGYDKDAFKKQWKKTLREIKAEYCSGNS